MVQPGVASQGARVYVPPPMTAESNIRKLYIIKMAKWFMLTMPILMLYYKEHGFSEA
jgi:hypothetical protein